jgi:hypothetical protein
MKVSEFIQRLRKLDPNAELGPYVLVWRGKDEDFVQTHGTMEEVYTLAKELVERAEIMPEGTTIQ